MQIEIAFPFFSLRGLDKEQGCLDYIEVHEGDANTEKFVGRFCGDNSPKKIVSSLNQIKIHFHADKKQSLGWYMGFQAFIKQKGKVFKKLKRFFNFCTLYECLKEVF